ncbi:hypothetical protein [Acinetobacter sp. YH16055]|uniref:hypothetical protein n=1 Tax=Acinetobacter sp. YH16055 TaxID=2601193 RepID=UPI0015D38A7D|nr:hypothetical protein [Acinetobacter sp. YH16055]
MKLELTKEEYEKLIEVIIFYDDEKFTAPIFDPALDSLKEKLNYSSHFDLD